MEPKKKVIAKNLEQGKVVVEEKMERFKQVEFGNKIKALVKKNVGISFTAKYQGSTKGKIAVMVIVGSNFPFISKVKTYLWSHLHIAPAKIIGHGGIDTTIVIKLVELEKVSLSAIDTEYSKDFPESLIPIVKMRDANTIVPAIEEVVKLPIDKPEHGKKSISQTLSSVFLFENQISNPAFVGSIVLKNFFTYDKKMENQFTVLNSKSEDIAMMIEKSLVWFIGNESLVFRLEEKILIDLSKLKEKKERSVGLLFCLPPNCNSSHSEVESRLRRVCKGTIPMVKDITDNSFKVNYSKKGSASKIYGLIKEMGWITTFDSDKELTVYLKEPEVAIVNKEEDTIPEIILAEEAEIIGEKVDSVVTEVIPSIEVKEPSVVLSLGKVTETDFASELIRIIDDKDKAFLELRKLWLNPKLFSRLPIEKQKKVSDVIKNELIERDPEYCTEILLNFFK